MFKRFPFHSLQPALRPFLLTASLTAFAYQFIGDFLSTEGSTESTGTTLGAVVEARRRLRHPLSKEEWISVFVLGLICYGIGFAIRGRRGKVTTSHGERYELPAADHVSNLWNDQNGKNFYLDGWGTEERFVYCLETTSGRHGVAITQRLKSIDDELNRRGFRFHKMILISPHPDKDSAQLRLGWMRRNRLDENHWSFVSAANEVVRRQIQEWRLASSARGDVRVLLANGKGTPLYMVDLHERPIQRLADEIVASSQTAFVEHAKAHAVNAEKGGVWDYVADDPSIDAEADRVRSVDVRVDRNSFADIFSAADDDSRSG